MNDNLMEALLNEEEGSSLDFKEAQYPFSGASDMEKSELLKDILTFTNAWRRSDAFILIGVRERVGARHEVVGVAQHLNDSDLQQFVNSKTQQPVEFSYSAYEFEGKRVGVITVARQTRPVFLKRSFGRLSAGVVYIRRGSSTGEALPDEVARMGSSDQSEKAVPVLQLELADLGSRARRGLAVQISSTVTQLGADIYKGSRTASSGGLYGRLGISPFQNHQYWEELGEYEATRRRFRPLGFVIQNLSDTVAGDVQVQVRCEQADMLDVLTEEEYPSKPSSFSLSLPTLSRTSPVWEVSRFGSSWVVTNRIGKIQPKETHWSRTIFWIGGRKSGKVRMTADVFADNLPEPYVQALEVELDVNESALGLLELYHLYKNTDK